MRFNSLCRRAEFTFRPFCFFVSFNRSFVDRRNQIDLWLNRTTPEYNIARVIIRYNSPSLLHNRIIIEMRKIKIKLHWIQFSSISLSQKRNRNANLNAILYHSQSNGISEGKSEFVVEKAAKNCYNRFLL